MYFRGIPSPCFTQALVDDWFVRSAPAALDRVGATWLEGTRSGAA
jgi:hypothetical protein